jgi:site-specific DNA recombinase
MIAAIYARKSRKQEHDESVELQEQRCRELAADRGWTVDTRYVFRDDGISGADFDRAGLNALRDVLARRPLPVQVLLVTDTDRLGREQYETNFLLKQLAQAGLQVVQVKTGRAVAMATATDKVVRSVTSFAGELEREQARHRTHQALLHKARQQHATGACAFGYRNQDVFPPGADLSQRPKRLYVTRVIHEPEAQVVRRIFELAAAGRGLRAMAHQLNAEGALAPRPRRRGRPRGWAPSSLRAVLHRELYRGHLVWNQRQKRDQWGLKHVMPRDPSDWVEGEAPALRIVSEELWQSAHARLAGTRAAYLRGTGGRLWGRPANGRESRYLLTGLASCGWCGATLEVRSRPLARRRVFAYTCTAYHRKGTSVCANQVQLPLALADDTLLEALETEILHPDVVERGLREALAELQRQAATVDPVLAASRADELRQVEQEMARLVTLVKMAGPSKLLAEEFRTLERRRAQLEQAQRPPCRPPWISSGSAPSSPSGGSGSGARSRSRGRCSACSSRTGSSSAPMPSSRQSSCRRSVRSAVFSSGCSYHKRW